MDQNKLLQAYSMLIGLKNNIPQYDILERYVIELNDNLEEIEKLSGLDLSKFKISGSDLEYRVTSFGSGGRKTYAQKRSCRRELYLAKLDGSLNFLSLLLKESPQKMGF